MGKSRLEAFSDGVLAIVITVMVLDLHVPHGAGFAALAPVLPTFLNYVLSFVYLGIYWSNHHHLLHAAERIHGGILWANLHLLFWLSLFPFVTAWMGENYLAAAPVALYGGVLFMAAIAYYLLEQTIIGSEGEASLLARAVGRDLKGKLSPVLYGMGIALAFRAPPVSEALYLAVALMWLVPDRRIERAMPAEAGKHTRP
jgi:uncharacterized membrane protein